MRARGLHQLQRLLSYGILTMALASGCRQPLILDPFEGKTYFPPVELALRCEPEDAGQAVLDEPPHGEVVELRESGVVTVTALANDGWQFSHWSGLSDSSENPLPLRLSGDGTLTAHFERAVHEVSLSVSDGGVIQTDPSDLGETATHGMSLRLSPRQSDGYAFLRWEDPVSGESLGAAVPLELSVTRPVAIHAVFSVLQYTLSTDVDGGGHIDVATDAASTTGSAEVPHGSTVTLSARPDPGYRFSHWSGDATGERNPTTLWMDAPKSVTAVFTQSEYRITTFTEGEGSVSQVLLDGTTLVHGGRVRFEADPAEGWRFLEWRGAPLASSDSDGGSNDAGGSTGGGSTGGALSGGSPGDAGSSGAGGPNHGHAISTDNPLILTAADDIELTAVFERVPLSVDLSASGRGSADARVLDTSEGFFLGTRVRLTADADPGWAFAEWQGDVTGSINPVDLDLIGDLGATAVFTRLEYEVEVSIEGAGTVTRAYDGEVAGLTRLRLIASPDPGWRFDGWSGDASGSATETTIALNSDKTAAARFSKIVYEIGYDVTGSGAVGLSGGDAVLGAELALHPEPSPGWSFAHWGNDPTDTRVPRIITVTGDTEVNATFIKNTWTILLYMSGDNELEPNMLDDINEIEGVDIAPHGINVIVLADRAEGHSTASGDWTGTRVYRIRHDPAGVNSTIVSERLSSEELGLSDSGDEEELNLGSGATLSAFLDYALSRYAADHTALVVWGHGGGYRGGAPSSPAGPAGGTKALSLDAASGRDTLVTPELGSAISGRGLSVIGLDVCYGAMLEIAYEIRHDTEYFIASQDVVSTDGWEYDSFLSLFVDGGLSPRGFADAAVDHFAGAYQSTQRAAISAIDLKEIDAVHTALNGLASAASAAVSSEETRVRIRSGIYDEVVGFYETPGDLAVDLGSLASFVSGKLPEVSANASILADALSSAVYRKYDDGDPETSGLSVHYVPVDAAGFPLRHDSAYFRGALVGNALEFVEGSSWVPNEQDESGLLYRLWYEVFE